MENYSLHYRLAIENYRQLAIYYNFKMSVSSHPRIRRQIAISEKSTGVGIVSCFGHDKNKQHANIGI